MRNIPKSQISFEKIRPTVFQIKTLYQILCMRRKNISHCRLPSLAEHVNFVNNHPYRAWYLIKLENEYIGSAYILKNNCIGIFTSKNSYFIFECVVNFLMNKYAPLPEIKSVRPGSYFINSSPEDSFLKSCLNKIGAKKIQVTYSLNDSINID